jgi:hypothetical protein
MGGICESWSGTAPRKAGRAGTSGTGTRGLRPGEGVRKKIIGH